MKPEEIKDLISNAFTPYKCEAALSDFNHRINFKILKDIISDSNTVLDGEPLTKQFQKILDKYDSIADIRKRVDNGSG